MIDREWGAVEPSTLHLGGLAVQGRQCVKSSTLFYISLDRFSVENAPGEFPAVLDGPAIFYAWRTSGPWVKINRYPVMAAS